MKKIVLSLFLVLALCLTACSTSSNTKKKDNGKKIDKDWAKIEKIGKNTKIMESGTDENLDPPDKYTENELIKELKNSLKNGDDEESKVNIIYVKVNKRSKKGIAVFGGEGGAGHHYPYIYKTVDGGKTWKHSKTLDVTGSFSVFFNGRDELFIAETCETANTFKCFHKSEDLGKTMKVFDFSMNMIEMPVYCEILPTKSEDAIIVQWEPINTYQGKTIAIEQLSAKDFSFEKTLYRNRDLSKIVFNYCEDNSANNKSLHEWLYKMVKKLQRRSVNDQDRSEINAVCQIDGLYNARNHGYQLIINAIYATHGFDFSKNKDYSFLEQYKKNYKIKSKKSSVKEEELNEKEKSNIKVLQSYSLMDGDQLNYPENY